MRDIVVTDADAGELRDALDAAGLTSVEVAGPDGSGMITVGVPDDVDGIQVDRVLQSYAGGRMSARVTALAPIANLEPSEGDVMHFRDGEWRSDTATVAVGYKEYAAILNHGAPPSAPTAEVLSNTLGGDVVWYYESAGQYGATLAGAFTAGRFAVIVGQYQYISAPFADNIMIHMEGDLSGDFFTLFVTDVAATVRVDGYLNNIFIQVRVYL